MERLPLPRIPPEAGFLFNKIFKQDKTVCFTLGTEEYNFSFKYIPPNAYTPKLGIKFNVDGHPLQGWLEEIFFKDSLDYFLMNGSLLELPEGVREAVVEAGLEELLDSFDDENGTATVIQEISFKPQSEPEGETLSFVLTHPDVGKTIRGYFSLDLPSLAFLSRLWEEVPAVSPDLWETLPIAGRMEIGKTRISLEAFKNLEKDDIILLDRCSLIPEGAVDLIFSPSLSFQAVLEKKILTIQEMRKNAMTDEKAALEELEITLIFELGEKKIPLGELLAVQPGFTFDLGKDLEKPVSIRANGKIVGFGELVQLDEHVGVRILEVKGYAGE
jgi:type III secretion protein Q